MSDFKHKSQAFQLAIFLNLFFVILEFGFGFWSDSLSLIGDAAHNLSDVLSLALSWFAFFLMTLGISRKFNFGYGKVSILVAFVNSLVLILTCLWILKEAIEKFYNPEEIKPLVVIIVAGIGFFINFFSARLFHQSSHSYFSKSKDHDHHHHSEQHDHQHDHDHHDHPSSSGHQHFDLNSKSAYLHLIGDALISLGVVISGLVIWQTGWKWVDPAISVVIAIVIAFTIWPILRDSFKVLILGVPDQVNYDEVKDYFIKNWPQYQMSELKVFSISTLENVLLARLSQTPLDQGTTSNRAQSSVDDSLKHFEKIKSDLKKNFPIHQIYLDKN